MINNEEKYLPKIIKIITFITKKKKIYAKYYNKNNIDINLFKKEIDLTQFLIEY